MRYFCQKIKKYKKIWLKINKIILIIFLFELIFPQYTIAQKQDAPLLFVKNESVKQGQVNPVINQETRLPENKNLKTKYKITIVATAYNSLPNQTDASPCITASGFNVCENNQENIIAANFLPMGTLVKIPKLYGDRLFRVEDRMHPKYQKHIDIWFKSYNEAIKFGRQRVEIEVY